MVAVFVSRLAFYGEDPISAYMDNSQRKDQDSAFMMGCMVFLILPVVLIGIIELIGFHNRIYWQGGVIAIFAVSLIIVACRRYRCNLRRKKEGQWTSLHE